MVVSLSRLEERFCERFHMLFQVAMHPVFLSSFSHKHMFIRGLFNVISIMYLSGFSIIIADISVGYE